MRSRMERDTADLLIPRILLVDDERQIHSSLRLRLYRSCELTSCLSGSEALDAISETKFDLCLVDLHMPGMSGLEFIAEARKRDPSLGHVVLSAFDSPENLRRTISLQVFDFLGKPFPGRQELESRIPEWVDRTRRQRRELERANRATEVHHDLRAAVNEREIEFVASETARDALVQVANLLTTVHAHLLTAVTSASPKLKSDPGGATLLRNIEVAKKTAEAAATVADSFFNSAYASRDTSPALIASGVFNAIRIATKVTAAEAANKVVDYAPLDEHLIVRNLSGMEFLLMIVPALSIALHFTEPKSTVGLRAEIVNRLDQAIKTPPLKDAFLVNRRHALLSQPGILLHITASVDTLSIPVFESWLKGVDGAFPSITSRGLVSGLQKCGGLLGISHTTHGKRFCLTLALPV